MSWLFSRALVAAFSGDGCSAGEPSALSNSTSMPEAFLWHGRTTEPSTPSQSGTTSEPLTDGHGEALLTSYREASLAKTSAELEPELESTELEAVSGVRWRASFAKYNPDSSSWKTAQCSLLGDSDEFSETWPRWGSMRNGESFLRPIPALPICASESGLWQTPVADDAIERVKGKYNSRGEPKLSAQVKLAPTPVASDTGFRKERYAQGGTALSTFVGGHLNPDWEEWLMGWPIGWSALEPLATVKYHEWRQQHGPFSAEKSDAEPVEQFHTKIRG